MGYNITSAPVAARLACGMNSGQGILLFTLISYLCWLPVQSCHKSRIENAALAKPDAGEIFPNKRCMKKNYYVTGTSREELVQNVNSAGLCGWLLMPDKIICLWNNILHLFLFGRNWWNNSCQERSVLWSPIAVAGTGRRQGYSYWSLSFPDNILDLELIVTVFVITIFKSVGNTPFLVKCKSEGPMDAKRMPPFSGFRYLQHFLAGNWPDLHSSRQMFSQIPMI